MGVKQTAFVVVRRSWFDDAMQPLITGTPSASSEDAHVMIGVVDDLTDLRGLWMADVPSVVERKEDSLQITMTRLLIPWQYILTVGLVDHAVKLTTGFANATSLMNAE